MAIVAAIQMTSTPDIAHNLATAAHWLNEAAHQQAQLAVLPEMFPFMGAIETKLVTHQEAYGQGPIQEFLAQQAKQHNMWLVAGTIPIASNNPRRVRSACIVYNNVGETVARYDKIHLFDVRLSDDAREYRESLTIEPGNQPITVDSPLGTLGLAVCYDLRFPELFRYYLNHGVNVFAVPSAFTASTGAAHWETLARSRCIENLCYGVYACQTGIHGPNRATYGHSMIIDPWGRILAQLPEGEGCISATIDPTLLTKLRTEFPVATHQRIFATKP